MQQELVELADKTANGYVIPLGPVNLVCVITDKGMVGCGAFDVAALDRFEYPAARISGISTIADLLEGTIKEANEAAGRVGIKAGMIGREALDRL